MNNFINSSALSIYNFLIAPKSVSEDNRRKEFILNVIVSGSVLLLIVLDIFVFYNSITLKGYRGVHFSSFSELILVFLTLLYLSRRGYYVIASYILIGIYYASISYTSYHWGIELPVLLLSYGLLIVIASILISTRFGFVITSLSVATILTLGYWEVRGISQPQLYWKENPLRLNNALEFSAILFLMMVISWLSNREIEKSLRRARNSEQALREERDLLELKVEERTQELKRLQLERISQLYRFAEFGRLASGLFHDLVNPLTALSLYMERLRASNAPEVAETRSYVGKAVGLTKRMETFIHGVSKQIQNRDLETVFPLEEEISQALQILGYKARTAQVELLFEPGEAAVKTFGNPLKFHQIVSNLVSNAIDAAGNENAAGKVRVRLDQQDSSIILLVSDNGPGIAPEHRYKIFEPFFTTKAPGKGSGIGLSTTKNIVEKDFGGSIHAENMSSTGTAFTVTIPVRSG